MRDAAVDGLLMIELLEHVPDPRRLLAEAGRVLRPSGVLLGSAPFMVPVHGDPHDYYRYSADGLRALLAGFDRAEILPFGNHWSAAWTLVSARSRILRLWNPLFRTLGGRSDARCPQGYVFTARAPARK